jgi:hypothetical protein
VRGPELLELATGYDYYKVHDLHARRDAKAAAEFVRRRLRERYVEADGLHPFGMMARNLLLVESLQSFWKGTEWTEATGARAFGEFFGRVPPFAELANVAGQFYGCIRNGILHQGETVNGWWLSVDGPLWDARTKTVGVNAFHDAIAHAVDAYAAEVAHGGVVADACLRKIGFILEHCRVSAAGQRP